MKNWKNRQKESKDQDKENQRIKWRKIGKMIKMKIGTKDKTPEQTTQPKITPNEQEKGK